MSVPSANVRQRHHASRSLREHVERAFNTLTDCSSGDATSRRWFLICAVPCRARTFTIMLAFGFSINALSLFGLVLAIGIVVDDASSSWKTWNATSQRGLSSYDAPGRP